MPRTVVPPVGFRTKSGPLVGGDDLPDRLVKYVPAETLAFFVPTAAAIGTTRDTLLVVVTVVGLIGTIGYLWLAGQRVEEGKRPLPHFYVLAGVAFLCWAVGTSANVSALVGMDATAAGIVLGMAVFAVPLLDELGTRLLRRIS